MEKYLIEQMENARKTNLMGKKASHLSNPGVVLVKLVLKFINIFNHLYNRHISQIMFLYFSQAALLSAWHL